MVTEKAFLSSIVKKLDSALMIFLPQNSIAKSGHSLKFIYVLMIRVFISWSKVYITFIKVSKNKMLSFILVQLVS